MKLRRLNEHGLAMFGEFLDSLTTATPQPYPAVLPADPEASEEVRPSIEIESRTFGSRMEAAKYLHERLSDSGISGLESDRGLWAWLALFYFEELCPLRSGRRAPGARARWIPEVSDYRRYYRHLLAGPYRIYRAHRANPTRALALLCGPLDRPGDIVEQFASRQKLVTNAAVMEVASALYVEPSTQKAKRGAGGRAAGSPRRLTDVLGQFDVTWDLYALPAHDLLRMLPREFSRFMPESTS